MSAEVHLSVSTGEQPVPGSVSDGRSASVLGPAALVFCLGRDRDRLCVAIDGPADAGIA